MTVRTFLVVGIIITDLILLALALYWWDAGHDRAATWYALVAVLETLIGAAVLTTRFGR